MPDQLPPSSRFYALIESGRMECPKCGLLLLWGSPRLTENRDWNPVGSLIRCHRCLAVYQLGVVAWPAARGGGGPSEPIDQVATVRQLAELRQRSGGFWVRGAGVPAGATIKNRPDKKRKARLSIDPVNVYVGEGCCCAPWPWRSECPVHGRAGVDQEPAASEPESEDPEVE